MDYEDCDYIAPNHDGQHSKVPCPWCDWEGCIHTLDAHLDLCSGGSDD